jgi:hypothetical protein
MIFYDKNKKLLKKVKKKQINLTKIMKYKTVQNFYFTTLLPYYYIIKKKNYS